MPPANWLAIDLATKLPAWLTDWLALAIISQTNAGKIHIQTPEERITEAMARHLERADRAVRADLSAPSRILKLPIATTLISRSVQGPR